RGADFAWFAGSFGADARDRAIVRRDLLSIGTAGDLAEHRASLGQTERMAPAVGPGARVVGPGRPVVSAVQRAAVQQPSHHEKRPGVRRSADLENDSLPATGSAYCGDPRFRDSAQDALRSRGRKEILAFIAALGSGVSHQCCYPGE